MNKTRILRLADIIETGYLAKKGLEFDMSHYWAGGFASETNQCGTAACLAGHAWVMSKRFNPRAIELGPYEFGDGVGDPHEDAARYLDLSDVEAYELFLPTRTIPEDFKSIDDITAPHAVAVLRHLAATGEVDWSVGAPE